MPHLRGITGDPIVIPLGPASLVLKPHVWWESSSPESSQICGEKRVEDQSPNKISARVLPGRLELVEMARAALLPWEENPFKRQ